MAVFFGRVLFLFNVLLAIYTLLVYQVVYSAEIGHWLAGFLTLSLPFAWVANLLFVIWWLLGRSWRVVLSLAILAIGYPLFKRTFHLTTPSAPSISSSKPFRVLSYNVMYMDASSYVHENDKSNALALVKTLDTLRADIMCFQELYNWDDMKDFRTIHMLTKRNPFYTYMHSSPSNNEGQGEIGLAIFSKYPIIRKKEVFWKLNNNGMISADVVIRKDTIRVINVQLRSMGIRVNKMLAGRRNEAVVKKEAKTILGQLKNGFQNRSMQVLDLEKWIKDSPHPVLVCGDFNELPYGFAYGRVRKYLNNAFEDGGKGFGFTYNKMPKFIRIDNQFYSGKHFNLLQFTTRSDIPYSDHYPLIADYQLK